MVGFEDFVNRKNREVLFFCRIQLKKYASQLTTNMNLERFKTKNIFFYVCEGLYMTYTGLKQHKKSKAHVLLILRG